VSDIDTAVVGSLKVLDRKWPIREADIDRHGRKIARSQMTQRWGTFPVGRASQTISTSSPSLAASQSCNSPTLPSISGDMWVKISRLAPIIGNFSRRVA
jgi:hypothetical protein